MDPLSPEGIAKMNGEAPPPKKETFLNKIGHFNNLLTDIYGELSMSIFGEKEKQK